MKSQTVLITAIIALSATVGGYVSHHATKYLDEQAYEKKALILGCGAYDPQTYAFMDVSHARDFEQLSAAQEVLAAQPVAEEAATRALSQVPKQEPKCKKRGNCK